MEITTHPEAKMTNQHYIEVKTGERVLVTSKGVSIERIEGRYNPEFYKCRWIVTARPKDPTAYAAKKVASGDWEAV